MQKSKKHLSCALIDLMSETPIDKLFVHDICEKADISRQTFYRYYADKYALLEEAFEAYVFYPLTETDITCSWEDRLVKKFKLMRQYRTFVRNGFLSSDPNGLTHINQHLLRFTLERILTQQNADMHDIRLQFAIEKEVSGSVVMIRNWTLGGMRRSEESMAHVMLSTSPEVLKSYLDSFERFNEAASPVRGKRTKVLDRDTD